MSGLYRYRDPRAVPPGGKFFYKDPETGMEFYKSTHDGLVESVAAHRKANGRPVPDNLSDIIADWICRRLPDGWCIDSATGAANMNTGRRTVTELLRRSREAQRAPGWGQGAWNAPARAAICARCPNHVPAVGCPGCVGLDDQLRSMLQGFELPNLKWLQACRVSGTFVAIEVFSDPAPEQPPTGPGRAAYPDHCWKSEAYRKKYLEGKP